MLKLGIYISCKMDEDQLHNTGQSYYEAAGTIDIPTFSQLLHFWLNKIFMIIKVFFIILYKGICMIFTPSTLKDISGQIALVINKLIAIVEFKLCY